MTLANKQKFLALCLMVLVVVLVEVFKPGGLTDQAKDALEWVFAFFIGGNAASKLADIFTKDKQP